MQRFRIKSIAYIFLMLLWGFFQSCICLPFAQAHTKLDFSPEDTHHHSAIFAAASYLQVGAFASYKHARKFADVIYRREHFQIRIIKSSKAHKRLYLVQIGPLMDPAHVVQIKQQLEKLHIPYALKFYNDTRVSKRMPKPSILKPYNYTKSFEQVSLAPPSLAEVSEVHDAHAHLQLGSNHKFIHLNYKIPKLLSLRDAVMLALRFNPNVQNAEIDRVAQKYSLLVQEDAFHLEYKLSGALSYTETKAFGEPTTTARSQQIIPAISYKSPLGTELEFDLKNSFNNGFTYSPTAAITLKQPLLRGFGPDVNEVNLRNAYDDEVINKLNLRQTITDTITKVMQDYRAVIQDNNDIGTQQRSLRDAEKTYADNQQRIRLGQLERTANIEQGAQVQSIKLTLQQSINNRDQALQNLLLTIGLDPNLKLSVPDNVSIEHSKVPGIKQSIYIALHNNTQYLQQIANFRKQQRALLVAKDQQRWQLDLNASTTLGNTSVNGNGSSLSSVFDGSNRQQNVNLQLNVPIDNVELKNQLVAARVALEQQNIQLAAAKRVLITNVKNQITQIKSSIQEVKLAAQAVNLANDSYQLEIKKQQLGRGTSLDVTTSQNRLIQAQIILINSKIAYLNAVAQFDSTLGITLHKWRIKLRY